MRAGTATLRACGLVLCATLGGCGGGADTPDKPAQPPVIEVPKPNPLPDPPDKPDPLPVDPEPSVPDPVDPPPVDPDPDDSAPPDPPPPAAPVKQVKVSYVPSDALFANPDRGLYRWLDCNGGTAPAQLAAYRAEGDTLVQCMVDLSAFINAPISQTRLDHLNNILETVRAAGLRTVMRFWYSADTNGADAPPARVTAHIAQLKPLIEQNRDVIAVVQAGFVGGWGEWAYSTHFGTMPALTAANWADRRAVVDTLLASVPADRMIQLRTPAFKRRFFGTAPLTDGVAYGGGAARVGHHNDCFLASDSDWGTYTDRTVEYPYLAADSAFVATGGETCNPAPPRSQCATALEEMAMFHWSYLNADYHPAVVNGFKTQGCYDEIRRRLGYRFSLTEAQYPDTAKAGSDIQIRFNVRNNGWAAPFNPREVTLVLRHTGTGGVTRLTVDADPRRWTPGEVASVQDNVMLPASLAAGDYELLLHLNDPLASVRDRAEYSVRLANDGVWENATGYNRLGHTLRITR